MVQRRVTPRERGAEIPATVAHSARSWGQRPALHPRRRTQIDSTSARFSTIASIVNGRPRRRRRPGFGRIKARVAASSPLGRHRYGLRRDSRHRCPRFVFHSLLQLCRAAATAAAEAGRFARFLASSCITRSASLRRHRGIDFAQRPASPIVTASTCSSHPSPETAAGRCTADRARSPD